jgi:GT2 family glycosyltransferase
VYHALGGFSAMRYGEDIDLSLRIMNGGYSCALLPDAWVYHKRRTNLLRFFTQVRHSGEARIALYRKYPDSLKVVHLLPAAFTVGLLALLVAAFYSAYALLPIGLYAASIAIDATIRTRSLRVGLLAVPASFIQLTGYWFGFLYATLSICGKRKT